MLRVQPRHAQNEVSCDGRWLERIQNHHQNSRRSFLLKTWVPKFENGLFICHYQSITPQGHNTCALNHKFTIMLKLTDAILCEYITLNNPTPITLNNPTTYLIRYS